MANGESTSSASGGIGVLGLLGVVFVTLKLCGIINWSWWWVTAPFWGGFALILAILIIIGLVYVLWGIVIMITDSVKNRLYTRRISKRQIEEKKYEE